MREMTDWDLPALKAILQDAQTMAAYEGPFSDAESEHWLRRQQTRYSGDGHGLWAVILRQTGQMIGQCGITWQDIDGQIVREIGYQFNRAFWHHGYAVEAARACRDWAFAELRTKELFAQVRDTNVPSMNVAIRLGMTIRSRFIKHYRGVDMPHYAFAISRATWDGFDTTRPSAPAIFEDRVDVPPCGGGTGSGLSVGENTGQTLRQGK
jgi:RimJ/RimL family protein N-acetyltransferase